MNCNSNKHIFALHYENLSVGHSGQHILIADQELYDRIAKVLRLKLGSELVLFNDQINALVRLSAFLKSKVECNVLNFAQNKKIGPEIVLAVGSMRGPVFEQVVYQAASQAVGTIVQLETSKSSGQGKQLNFDRLNKIVISAREQSKNFNKVEIAPTLPIEKLDQTFDLAKHQVLLFDQDGESFNSLQLEENKPFLLILGAQEGFTNDEIQALVEKGAKKVTLGKTILKAEIACAVATGLVRALVQPGLSEVD